MEKGERFQTSGALDELERAYCARCVRQLRESMLSLQPVMVFIDLLQQRFGRLSTDEDWARLRLYARYIHFVTVHSQPGCPR